MALDYFSLQFDDAKGGAPFYMDGSARSYLSPSAAAQVTPTQGDDPSYDGSEGARDWSREWAGAAYWLANGVRRYWPLDGRVTVAQANRAHDWASGTYGASVGEGTPFVDFNPVGDVPGGSLFHERGQWDPDSGQYVQPINWNNIANIGVGTFLTFGAINAFTSAGAAASGGSAGVASGSSASAAIPAAASGSLVGTGGGAAAALTAAKLGSAALSTALGIKAAVSSPKPPSTVNAAALGSDLSSQLNDPRVKLAIVALVVIALVKGKR